MFRTKNDVDNHVRAVFRNIKVETERNLRSHNIAKLYLAVGDFDSARHYISTFLSVRPDHAGGYKVLGQAYEGLKQKEKALEAYKRSCELEPKQPDVVIKVCELLLETNPYLSPKVAQYWLERAQDIQSHHPVVFSLKKHMVAGKGDGESPKTDDLELLIKKEIDIRPKDANLQIQLLQLFLETNRKDVAYKHAVELEATGPFRQDILWYQCLSDVMKAYRENTPTAAENSEFHIHNVGVLLQQVALKSYQESEHGPGHLQALCDLDQALFEANEVLKKKKEKLLEECVHHASSQLCLHLGIALLRSGKQSRLGWREYVKQAQPLLVLAAMPRIEVTPIVSKKEAMKKRFKIWEVEKAYCRSQAGHVVLSMAKEGASQFLNRVYQFCCQGWREKLYQRIFSAAAKEKGVSTSFFVHYDGFGDVPGSLPSPTSLIACDTLSQQMHPESLHHLVWLGLQNWSAQSKKNEFRLDHGLESPLSGFRLSRDFSCNVFENLQWSAGNLKWSGTDSLSRLDVDAFLYASIFCAASTLKRQRDKGLIIEDRPPVLPADLTDPLCSPQQARWWNMAWQMHSGTLKKSVSNPSYGEVRALIQRGLEVIRALGNHGLDVKLIVLLAKTFEEKASSLSAHFDESSNGAQMDARAHVYWTTALTLLERMDRSEIITMADNRLFRFEGDELSRTDIKALLEEGRFFMACRLMRAEQHEEAALSFNQLKSPYASFYQALMYKKMADNVIGNIQSENITSDMRSDHSILLLKARSALHLTLDRLRAPHMHPSHPLNAELGQHLDDVEGRLAHIELNMMNRNACDGTSDDSASSQNSVDEQGRHSTIVTSSVVPNGRGPNKSFQCSTPRSRRAERSVTEKEARPSPERLDAQIRHLANTNDTLLQSVLEQNRAILASNKGILEALEKNQQAVQDMRTRISTLQDEVSKLKVSEAPTGKTVIEEMQQQFCEIRQEIAKLKISDIGASLVRDEKDEELYVFGDEEEAEDPQLGSLPQFPPTYQNPYQPLANNVQGASRRNVYQPTQPIVPPLLPHNFFPQTQVPVGVGRNVDPATMLYSQNLMTCYSALGLPFDGLQQTAQQAQVPDYSTSSLVSLLYGNQQAAAAAAVAQPAAAANVLRPQFTPVMPFGSPAMNLRPPTLPSTPVVAPPQTEVSTPRFGADLVPHNYQISMPAQPTIPSAASVEKNLSPSQPISTCALLKDVPSPMYSAVSTPVKPLVKQSPANHYLGERHTSICSEDGSYVEEAECQGEFTPQIPLPEEVVVTTGEENEMTLFDERAKLFRFVDGEWKERGIGQMKVLRHRDTKKSRILMRREQVHKVCANHTITEDIKFESHKSSENSLLWVAQDYAEEKVILEKFCVRFKTAEQTARFKKVCEEARELNKALSTPTKSQATAVSSSTGTPASVATTPATTPLSTLSFGLKVEPGNSSFSSPLLLTTSSSPATAKTPVDAVCGDDSYVEEYTPSVTFTPVIPLPDEVPVVTGEEDETPLFSHRAKLYRFVNREWKERGVGDLKILKHNEMGNVRLVMRREQTHKVCANHFITADIELKMQDSKDRWMWCACDFAEEKMQNETFCVKFKTEEAGLQFKEAFEKGRELSKVAKSPSKLEASVAVTSKVAPTTTKPVSSLFGQPAALGSGEKITFGGFTMSSKPLLKPVEEIGKSETDSAPVAQVKPNPFCGLNFSSSSTPIFGSSKVDAMPSFSSLASSVKSPDVKETTAPDQRPLKEVFKPKEGSWNCTSCYVANTADKTACECCGAKPAPKPNVFSGTGGFVFGTPKTDTSIPPPQYGFGLPSKPDVVCAVSSTPVPKPASTDARPLSEMFKPKEGSWSCNECYTSNTADKKACICCETPKPGYEETAQQEGQKKDWVSVGGLKSKVDLSTGGQTFRFGVPPSAQSGIPSVSTTATSAFGTTLTTPTNAAAKKVQLNLQASTYSFGVPKEDGKPDEKPKDAGFVFGGSSSLTTSTAFSNNNPPGSFSFGSSSFAFNLQGMKSDESLSKSPGKDSTSGDEPGSDGEDDHDNLHFKPIIPLPDKVAVVTGEEDEDVLFSQRAKLYRYVDKEWKERGTGDVKVLKHKTEGRLRLLMRRAQVHKICLNHFLNPDIEFTSKDAKSWSWSAQDFSEGQIETTLFAIRFKDSDIASSFKNAIDKALVDYVSPSGKSKQADKGDVGKEHTNVDSKSGVARALFNEPVSASSTDDEPEIVYETGVTPEEREAALKLQLPVYFYSYRRKPPCEGCRGCEPDEEPGDKPAVVNQSKFSFVAAAGDTDAKPSQPLWVALSTNTPVFNFKSFSNKPQLGTSPSPAVSTKGSIFGGSKGSTSPSIFGSFSTTTTTTPIFTGTPTTTTAAPIFASTPTTTTTAPVFAGTPTTTSTALIFGGTTTTTSTTLIFGGTPTATTSAPNFGGNSTTSSASIFSGTTGPVFGSSTVSSSQPVFGKAAFNAASATDTAVDSTKTATLTFGSGASSTPSFGSLASNAPSFGSLASGAAPTFGSTAPTFGSAAPTFGSAASSAAPSFGSMTSSAAPTFGSVASSAAFGSVTSSAAPTFGSVASKEDEAVPFLPVDSSLSFAAVSRNAKPVMQDSNKSFQFAGAGSQVFGSAIPETDKSKNKAKKGDDGESSGDENETGHEDSHDPQFKPIIPLPDAIEVRTGEEDETKLFCERAKVFRYSDDKQWKERGVGEMKILYHPTRNSYRLLLRREQVHKVVLNEPLTLDLELTPLSTSETAWCWGGMNYAEDPEGTLEKLAVRFKTVELAKNFKETLESCQEKLRLNTSAATELQETDEVEEVANSPSDESNNEEDSDQNYDYYIDPTDVLCYDSLLEGTGDLEEDYDGTWKPLGEATAALVADPQTGMGSVIVKKDETVVCHTAQCSDDSYTVDGNYFEWTSFDLSAGSHRTLRIRLPSEEAALEFKTKLEDVVPPEGELEEEDDDAEEDEGEEGEED